MKKLLAILAFGALAASASASELWWLMDTAAVDEAVGSGWTTARVMANTTGYNFGEGTEMGTVSKDDLTAFGDAFTTIDGDYANSAYYFYVELLNAQEEVVGKTYMRANQGAVNYNDIKGAIAGDVMGLGATTAYSGFTNFTTANVVPEPTSGLLTMLGLVLLGLKRKRA